MVKGKEKGVTIVETVVAMAILSIVSSIVFLSCSLILRTQAQNRQTQFFVNETENVMMCYYSDDFEAALVYLTGSTFELDAESDSCTIYYGSHYEYCGWENAAFDLTIRFADPANVSVTCKNLSSGKTIYSFGGAK